MTAFDKGLPKSPVLRRSPAGSQSCPDLHSDSQSWQPHKTEFPNNLDMQVLSEGQSQHTPEASLVLMDRVLQRPK